VSKVQDQVDWKRSGCFGAGGIRVSVETLIPVVLLCLSVFPSAAQTNSKNVLVVFTQFHRGPNLWLDSIESTARARVPGAVNFFSSYLEYSQLNDRAYLDSEAETLHREYHDVKFDLVIAVAYPALEFAVQHRDKIFPGVPIVFTSIDPELELKGQKWPSVTGYASRLGIGETVDLALRLHPDTKAVAVISHDSGLWWAAAHSALLPHQDKVREIDIIGLPSSQMLERVASLPPHAVVVFQVLMSEYAQPATGIYDAVEAIAMRLPTYSPFINLALGHGGIGGADRDIPKEARLTGELAGRVLSGERADDIPIVNDFNVQFVVDWRALQRWHIPESALPAGSVILYRPPSLWESYRRYVIATIVVIAVLLLLIIGLLWERARKRKAEAELRESEKRFRVMTDTTPSLVWMCDPKGKITYLNERRIAFTGPGSNAGYGDSWATYVHPDDLRNVKDGMSQGLKDRQPFSREYRLRRSDGVYRWMFDVATPRVNGDGSFGGFIGSAIDVTEQKLAQQALEQVSGQLIEAQEKERRRIARDLHDDICQRLALLSMEIEQTNRSSNELSKPTKTSLEEIRRHCSEIAGDVQSLSHQLHSSKLDYLGITAAIRGFCNEFSKQHGVSVKFTDRDVPRPLPKDVSLCLFRVAQEALHNAVKYSGMSEFTVELSGVEDAVHLVVSDAGAGFDVEEARKRRGLGLLSMQERVHLVQGTFSVESQPGEGTRILALVPVAGVAVSAGDHQVLNVR
jgi:PAS domain S-box-containing protein